MSVTIEDVLDGLYTKITTGAFNTNMGGRIYWGVAPRETTKPYAVLNLVSSAFGDTFDKGGFDLRVQVSVVHGINAADAHVQSLDNLRSVLHRGTLTVSGHDAMTCVELAAPIGPQHQDGEAWVSFVDYAVRGHES